MNNVFVYNERDGGRTYTEPGTRGIYIGYSLFYDDPALNSGSIGNNQLKQQVGTTVNGRLTLNLPRSVDSRLLESLQSSFGQGIEEIAWDRERSQAAGILFLGNSVLGSGRKMLITK